MTTSPEFSRCINVDKIGRDPVEQAIEAKPAERAALAKRFAVQDIETLTASFTLSRDGNQVIFLVKGVLKAQINQLCVVTAEPLPVTINEAIQARFLPSNLYSQDADTDLLSDWDSEPLEDDRIDLGELAAQHMALALDPYPRKPGVEADHLPTEALEEGKSPSPFAILQKMTPID